MQYNCQCIQWKVVVDGGSHRNYPAGITVVAFPFICPPHCLLWPWLHASSFSYMEVEKPSSVSAAKRGLTIQGLSSPMHLPALSGWPKCYQTWPYHAAYVCCLDFFAPTHLKVSSIGICQTPKRRLQKRIVFIRSYITVNSVEKRPLCFYKLCHNGGLCSCKRRKWLPFKSLFKASGYITPTHTV